MPRPIILSELDPPVKSATNPMASTRADLRDGSRGDSGVVTSVVDNGDGTLTIQGGNFGSKAQAAPILYDHTDVVWEHGVANTHQAGFAEGQAVLRLADDASTLWHKPTIGSGAVKVVRDRPKRHPQASAHYYGEGADTFLGWPNAFGGETPTTNSSDFFFHGWLKYPFNMSYFYAIPAEASPSNFDAGLPFEYGEEISVSGISGTGKIIDYQVGLSEVISQGWLFFEPPPGVSVNSLKGATITGLTSGAAVTFPESASNSGFDGNGYISPRGKYARFWNDSAATGHAYAWGNLGIAGTGTSLWAAQAPDGRGRTAHKHNQWSRFELKFRKNAEQVYLETRIDGAVHSTSNQEWSDSVRAEIAENLDHLSIALLGVNDFATVPWRFEAADIYADTTFNRVVIADNADYSQAQVVEMQRTLSWEGSEITVSKFLGAISGQPYLFVFDADDTLINSVGVPVQ